jgi:hypothetical protein
VAVAVAAATAAVTVVVTVVVMAVAVAVSAVTAAVIVTADSATTAGKRLLFLQQIKKARHLTGFFCSGSQSGLQPVPVPAQQLP